MLIRKKEVQVAMFYTNQSLAKTPATDKGYIALAIVVEILKFIDEKLLRNGEVVEYDIKKPWHWWALAKLGHAALKIIFRIIKAKLDAND